MENNDNSAIMNQIKSLPNLMGTNIQVSTFHGNPFFHTISSKARWEAESKTYLSPQAIAFDYCEDVILLARETDKGKEYGGLSLEELRKVAYDNHHIYEILKGKLKPYFDIEFEFSNTEEKAKKVASIWKIISKVFKSVGIKWKFKSGRDFYSDVIGTGEQGSFEGIKKYSAHMVINNGYYFNNCDEAKTFALAIKQEIIANHVEWSLLLDGNADYTIDFGVYTKNRLFKLPYQSKNNKGKISTRIQLPIKDSPNSLEAFLVSYVSEDMKSIDVSKIVLQDEKKSSVISNKKGVVISNRKVSSSVRNFLEEFKLCLPDECPLPDGEADTHSLEYIVKSIHNPHSLPHSVWISVGMAIKRASGGEGFQLWVDWSNKGKQSSSRNMSEMMRCWSGFTLTTGFGFTTLLDMAKMCNPKLVKPKPYDILFQNTITGIKTYEVDRRYLVKEDFHLESEVSFICSPMGTGKSYNLHEIVSSAYEIETKSSTMFGELSKHERASFDRIVYLSSKRAFATDMGKEFEKDGFKNYIDLSVAERYDCDRIIISLESFHQIDPENIDLLIIDESESVFKIIGSKTLQQKGEGLNNLLVFEKAIRTAKRTLVMDAFLSRRSFDVMKTIVGDKTMSLTINKWRPDKRTWVSCEDKDTLYSQIKKKIEAGKRCVLVSGSKNFAVGVVDKLIKESLIAGELDSEGVYIGKDVKLYHSGSPLSLETNVNDEWSNCKILIYSPTITCGVSYTAHKQDSLKAFNNLFVYAVNKGSACFRDTTQAIKRVRHFNDSEVFVCLNDNFRGHDIDENPIYLDKIRELIYKQKTKIFTDEKHYISLNSTDKEKYQPLKTWVSTAVIYNMLEDNLSDRYLREVATKYLELENILPVEKKIEAEICDDWIQLDTFVPWNEIGEVNLMKYNELMRKKQGEALTLKEIFYIFKQDFILSLRDDFVKCEYPCGDVYIRVIEEGVGEIRKQQLFDHYFQTPEMRSTWYNLVKMKEKLHEGFGKWFNEKKDASKVLELNTFADERLAHAYRIMKHLGIIQEGCCDTEYLDFRKTFTKQDLEPLLPEYEKLRVNGGLKSFNQLLQHKRSRSSAKDGEKANTMDTDKLYNMFKMLLKDTFGYTCEQAKRKYTSKMVNGKKKNVAVSTFMVGCLHKQFGNILDYLRDQDDEVEEECDYI
jgi:hypothetical protein